MNPADNQRFSAVMMGLSEIFGGNLSPVGLKLFFTTLKRFDIEQVEKAAYSILETRQFTKMPTPADFVEAIEGKVEDVGALEALDVLQKIKSVGSYESVKFSDPVTMAVIDRRFGGWPRVCELEEENEKWFLRDFASAYLSISKGGVVPKLTHLPGRIEIQNMDTPPDTGPRRLEVTLPLREPADGPKELEN